jgi:hypothetical protein
MARDLRNLKTKLVLGAVAGNVTVTGIRTNDKILAVHEIDFTLTEGVPNTRTWVPADRTAEFKIAANNVINNAAGTSTANKLLLVIWIGAHERGGVVI